MALTTKLNGTNLFPPEIEKELFSKVKGFSSLAKLSGQEAIPFVGKDIFTFDIDSDISIVGEGEAKPEGGINLAPVQIRPIKVVYQARVSDEFLHQSEEYQISVLRNYADAFAKKLGAGFDKMGIQGINPKTKTVAVPNNNYFDYKLANLSTPAVVAYDAANIDKNIDAAVQFVTEAEYSATGIIMSPAAASAMGQLTTSGKQRTYPDFAFGGAPEALGNMQVSVNPSITTSAGTTTDHILVGDFSKFRWGIAENIPLEIIEYGDPDNTGKDLKGYNQILLRSEAYIGWGILDPSAFALVQA